MTNELEPLKECPFCGGEAEPIEMSPGYGFIVCSKCGASTNPDEEMTPEELTKAWNTRYKRTCNVIIEDECPVCSECQQDIDQSWVACPYCGAEVVDGD